jgi:hypothetical protein
VKDSSIDSGYSRSESSESDGAPSVDDEITRGQQERDGESVRVYEYGGDSLLSVTTVLDHMNHDDTGLETWRSRNEGLGDEPYWRHLFWYKRHRGTLGHYRALNGLTEEELYGDDESQSKRELQKLEEGDVRFSDVEDERRHEDGRYNHEANHSLKERRLYTYYSISRDAGAVQSFGEFVDHLLAGTGPSGEDSRIGPRTPVVPEEAILKRCYDDTRAFDRIFQSIATELEITPESVVTVEEMVFDYDLSVAGQPDLVYDDPHGDRVLADLKTSSGMRDHYPHQAVVYGEVLPYDIDRYEVIRIHPDTGTWQVHTNDPSHHIHTNDGWDSTPQQLFEEFSDVAERVSAKV